MSVFRRGATVSNTLIEYDAFPGLAESPYTFRLLLLLKFSLRPLSQTTPLNTESKGTEPRFRNIQPIRKRYRSRLKCSCMM